MTSVFLFALTDPDLNYLASPWIISNTNQSFDECVE